MLKKICSITILLCILINFRTFASNAYANDKTVNVIKDIAPHLTDNENKSITRGDCIKIIMKIIGVEPNIANMYANACYDQPVFSDLEYDDANAGYIIISKFAGVSVGIQRNEYNTLYDFCPKRSITVKECLTFMLRCLKSSDEVVWDNVMSESVEVGLLQKNELETFIANDYLSNKDFCTLLCRMLNMNRYLYWPKGEPSTGHAKSMQIDPTNSISYIDWILQTQEHFGDGFVDNTLTR